MAFINNTHFKGVIKKARSPAVHDGGLKGGSSEALTGPA